MKSPQKGRPKSTRKIDDIYNVKKKSEPAEESFQQVIALKDKRPSRYQQENSSSIKSNSKEHDYQDMDVPIYKLQTISYSIKATLSQQQNAFFAQGNLIGNFYTIDGQVKLQKVKFIGNFKGSVEFSQQNQCDIFFEGTISQFMIIRTKNNESTNLDPVFEELQYNETNFNGFFKGSFYRWADIPTLSDEQISPKKLFRLQKKLSNNFQSRDCNELIKQQLQSTKKLSKLQYFLPTVVRFQVHDIRQIYLDRSLAAISGVLFVEIRYNDEIKQLFKKTKQKIKASKNIEKYKNLLKIELNFHRDFNLTLELDDDDDEDDDGSEGSEWSILDKTWDIVKEDDAQNQILKFRIWKRFNAQIDNSYGSFFAPFNISSLKIVMTLHHFSVLDQNGNTVKVHLIGTDVLDYDPKIGYNPFKAFNDLQAHKRFQEFDRIPHMNRIHKINRFNCKDTGTFMIADNRLRLYPYFRNILQNTYTQNEDLTYALGIKERISLVETPDVRSIADSYEYFNENSFKADESETPNVKVETFKFQKWSYIIIEIPIFKYLVIDMMQVFVPLFLLAIISLLIFTSQNGVYNSEYNILAYRLINVASLLIAYVSLIPVIRQNLPPMPGVTLIELITYLQVAPNMLAILSSLLEYQTPFQTWIVDYKVFSDGLFIISFVISCLNMLTLVVLFTVYIFKQYRINGKIELPNRQANRSAFYKYRSPCYLQFMEKVKRLRKQCLLETDKESH